MGAQQGWDQCECTPGCGSVRATVGGARSEHLTADERKGKCYPVAYRFVKHGGPDSGAVLVHGTIQKADDVEPIGHAWVVYADWVWEPTTNAWFHSEEAFAASTMRAVAKLRVPADEAIALRAAGQPIGEWIPDADDLEFLEGA